MNYGYKLGYSPLNMFTEVFLAVWRGWNISVKLKANCGELSRWQWKPNNRFAEVTSLERRWIWACRIKSPILERVQTLKFRDLPLSLYSWEDRNDVSKLLELAAEIVVNGSTGKRRILTHIYRDETLDISFVMDSNEAEQWGAKLMYLAAELRKKNPQPETFHLTSGEKLWNRIYRKWKDKLMP